MAILFVGATIVSSKLLLEMRTRDEGRDPMSTISKWALGPFLTAIEAMFPLSHQRRFCLHGWDQPQSAGHSPIDCISSRTCSNLGPSGLFDSW